MLFNKKENQETVKKKKKAIGQKVQEATEQMAAAPVELPIEARQRPAAAKEKRPSRTSQIKKKEPISVIDNWTGEDMVKGIVLSEILGPPKSKRKK